MKTIYNPKSVFTKEVVLRHSHTHLFLRCLGLPVCDEQGENLSQTPDRPQGLKYLLSGPLQKR